MKKILCIALLASVVDFCNAGPLLTSMSVTRYLEDDTSEIKITQTGEMACSAVVGNFDGEERLVSDSNMEVAIGHGITIKQNKFGDESESKKFRVTRYFEDEELGVDIIQHGAIACKAVIGGDFKGGRWNSESDPVLILGPETRISYKKFEKSGDGEFQEFSVRLDRDVCTLWLPGEEMIVGEFMGTTILDDVDDVSPLVYKNNKEGLPNGIFVTTLFTYLANLDLNEDGTLKSKITKIPEGSRAFTYDGRGIFTRDDKGRLVLKRNTKN